MVSEFACVLVILPCLALASSSGHVITNSSGETCVLLSGAGFANEINASCSSCNGVYAACRELLDGILHEHEDEHVDESNSTAQTLPSKAEVYGYGFLLSIAISCGPLLALVLVPCLKQGTKFYFLYKPINALMMGLASFALLADAVLHILPEVFPTNEETNEEGHDDAHSGEQHQHDLGSLWRGCLLLATVYILFVLEFFLHAMRSKSVGSHGHSHQHADSRNQQKRSDGVADHDNPLPPTPQSQKGPFQMAENSGPKDKVPPPSPNSEVDGNASCFSVVKQIKPLAWLIIIGDTFHNFCDGVALGASISVSLSLGISTAIAIVFHEIPHELGDFAILISSGMNWYVAFLFNLLSSVPAIVGFFIGAAIGTNSETAVEWILSATIGIFLYIALVDLLPSIIHNTEKGWMLAVIFVMANIGFAISFVALLLIALYEEELNNIVN